jgi:hypothetical protein
MAVEYFSEIDLPFADAAPSLAKSPKLWIIGPETSVDADGKCFVSDVGLAPEGPQANRDLRLTLDRPTSAGSTVAYRVSYTSIDDDIEFPAIEGELLVTDRDRGVTRLELRLDYVGLADVPANLMDRALLWRIAWPTLNDVAAHICEGAQKPLHHHHAQVMWAADDTDAARRQVA